MNGSTADERVAGDDVTAGAPVPVLVVDDQAPFRAVMREVVAAAPGFELASEARSGEEALKSVEEKAPRVVIVDKRLPDVSGIEVCRAITDRHPDIVVLICSVEDLDPRLAYECGAARAVHKQHLSPRLLVEVWRAHGGDTGRPSSRVTRGRGLRESGP